MVKVVYKVKIIPEKEKEFEEIIRICTKSANETEGCIQYSFYHSVDNSQVYLVYYQCTSDEVQQKHIENLRVLLGPSPEGRDLPKRFLDLVAEEELVLLERS